MPLSYEHAMGRTISLTTANNSHPKGTRLYSLEMSLFASLKYAAARDRDSVFITALRQMIGAIACKLNLSQVEGLAQHCLLIFNFL